MHLNKLVKLTSPRAKNADLFELINKLLGCSREPTERSLCVCCEVLETVLTCQAKLIPDSVWDDAWESPLVGDRVDQLLIAMANWIHSPNGASQALIRYVWAMRRLGVNRQQIEEKYCENRRD